MITIRPLSRALWALAVAAAVLLVAAAPAAAHGGEGQMEITSVTRDGGDVTVVVRLISLSDGHGVQNATVTVVVGEATPVPMQPAAEDGDYQATVPAEPGAPLRVTSVEPATTVETAAPPAADAPTSTTEATTTTATTEPTTESTTTAPTDDEAAADPLADQDAGDSGDGGTSLVVIGAVAVVVAAVVAMAVILLGRKPSADEGVAGP